MINGVKFSLGEAIIQEQVLGIVSSSTRGLRGGGCDQKVIGITGDRKLHTDTLSFEAAGAPDVTPGSPRAPPGDRQNPMLLLVYVDIRTRRHKWLDYLGLIPGLGSIDLAGDGAELEVGLKAAAAHDAGILVVITSCTDRGPVLDKDHRCLIDRVGLYTFHVDELLYICGIHDVLVDVPPNLDDVVSVMVGKALMAQGLAAFAGDAVVGTLVAFEMAMLGAGPKVLAARQPSRPPGNGLELWIAGEDYITLLRLITVVLGTSRSEGRFANILGARRSGAQRLYFLCSVHLMVESLSCERKLPRMIYKINVD